MGSINRLIAVCVSAALFVSLGSASAQPPKPKPGAEAREPKPGAEAREEARKARGQAAKERRDQAKKAHPLDEGTPAEAAKARHEARKKAAKAGATRAHRRARGAAVSKEVVAARRAFWAKRHEEQKKDRAERVKARQKEIQEKWGDLPTHEKVRAELKVHAWRMARLNAIKEVAKEEGKTELVERADKLIEKETTRHERRMAALKKDPDAAEAASGSGDDTKATEDEADETDEADEADEAATAD